MPDSAGTTIAGVPVTIGELHARVTAAGWRVVAWQFDAAGTSTPLSAFRRE